jgi:hypothetical protein
VRARGHVPRFLYPDYAACVRGGMPLRDAHSFVALKWGLHPPTDWEGMPATQPSQWNLQELAALMFWRWKFEAATPYDTSFEEPLGLSPKSSEASMPVAAPMAQHPLASLWNRHRRY